MSDPQGVPTNDPWAPQSSSSQNPSQGSVPSTPQVPQTPQAQQPWGAPEQPAQPQQAQQPWGAPEPVFYTHLTTPDQHVMEHHHWKRCIEYSRYGDLHHRCDTIFALVQYTPQPPSSSRKHGIIRSSFPQLQQRHRPLQVRHPEEWALIRTCGHGELLCAYRCV